MLLFRSEEHVASWCRERNVKPGFVMPLEQTWQLSQVWYGNRLTPDFHGRTPQEAAQILLDAGLTGDFWAL